MYNRIQVKMQAKESLKGNWGIAIGTTVVATLILGACNSIAGIRSVAMLVLSGVFSAGLAIVMLEIVRNWEVKFTDMFKGFNNFGTNCIAGILVSIFTFLWSLLLVIPGIIKAYSYSMTYYILADHPEMSAKDAIKTSQVMMDGHKMDLFVLELSFIGWYLLCGITLGLAGLYVGPYVSASHAAFYEAIKDEKVAAAAPEAPAEEPEVVSEAPVDETAE